MSHVVSCLPPARTIAFWRVLCRGLGVLVALFTFCFWAAKGYHTGWTQNELPVKDIDPITEIEYIRYEKGFVPGVDYLGGGILVGIVSFAVTFFGRRGPKPA